MTPLFQIPPALASGSVVYFAMAYPHSYAESQGLLAALDARFALPGVPRVSSTASPQQSRACAPLPTRGGGEGGVDGIAGADGSIYYHRELAVLSIEGRRVDLLTITSAPLPPGPPPRPYDGGGGSGAAAAGVARGNDVAATIFSTAAAAPTSALYSVAAQREETLPGLFPDARADANNRPLDFGDKVRAADCGYGKMCSYRGSCWRGVLLSRGGEARDTRV